MEAAALTGNDLSAENAYARLKHKPQAEQIGIVTKQFEAVFIRQFLKEALDPMIEGSLDEGGSANDIYRDFLVDSMAQSIASGPGLGFSNLLQSQLQDTLPSPTEEDSI